MFRDNQGRFVLAGDGTFRFGVVVDGDDLLVENVRATWFGGMDDKDDNGETASGVLNNQEGRFTPLGCALPIPGGPRTSGSPFPMLPWRIQVRVYNCGNHRMITVPLIDRGPAKPPFANAALDLTQSAFAALGGNKAFGHITVNFRVLGGVRYLSSTVRSTLSRG